MESIVCHTTYDLMILEGEEWKLHFKYRTYEDARSVIQYVAKAHPEYSKFKVVRFDENVILQIDRKHAINPPK